MLLITLLSRGYRTCFYGGNGRGGGRISVKINVCWSEKQNELRRYSFSNICTMLYSTLKYSSLTLQYNDRSCKNIYSHLNCAFDNI